MTTKNSQETIRELLQKELGKPKVDYGRVLELSLQLSEFDTENVRFSVDASHISRLGRELVVKKETAVSELVKNAFDADSTRVTLTFIDADIAGGSLVIEDDGHGMTREQLINGFMRLSTTDKIHTPYSPIFHRLRAGRKGIGRFAAQRLGKTLTITTQTKDDDRASCVYIDWEHFGIDRELITISSQIKEIEKNKIQGTRLTIENLEDGWTVAALEKVYRYLADLLQPFPISEKLEIQDFDLGFEIKICRLIGRDLTEVASAEKMIFDYALGEIEGIVDENGIATWKLTSKQLDINEKGTYTPKIKNKKFQYLRNINLKAYYYIYNTSNSSFLPKHIDKLVRELAEERGGIRVYRNGFRVLPYGEPDDDWLRLDSRSARREILPPFRNKNFLGFVELIDPKGVVFEETASREGLIENEGLDELKDFINDVLVTSVLHIAEARSKKTRPTASREIPPAERLKKVAGNLRQAVEDVKVASSNAPTSISSTSQPEILELIQTTISSLEEIAIEQEEQTIEQLNETSMLRVLASLGLAIGEFTHEIRQMFSGLLADTNSILEENPKGVTNEKAQRLKENIGSLKTYAAYFDKAVSANVRRETSPQDVSQVVRAFWKVVTPACKRYGIEFPDPTIQGYDLITIPMHASEWNSILFNLFTNAYKAIVRAGRDNGKGKIFIRAWRGEGKVFVEFSDNGDGIQVEHQERIFDAFFTTSLTAKVAAENDEQDELLGTGLGLKIIRDIVTAYNGEITLIGAARGYVTSFRVEIPQATYKQMEAYGY